MTHDRFEERLRDAARDYHTPPPVPRDDMWAEIAARRDAERARVVRPWMRWGIRSDRTGMFRTELPRASSCPT